MRSGRINAEQRNNCEAEEYVRESHGLTTEGMDSHDKKFYACVNNNNQE